MKYTPVHATSVSRKAPRLNRVGRFLDSVIQTIAPVWGGKRKIARLRSDLAVQGLDRLGASWTRPDRARDERWLVTGMSPNSVMETDLEELQERCVECYRTNNVASAAIEGRVANEVGTGIKVQARTEDKVANEALDYNFTQWSESGVDSTRSMSFLDLEKVINRNLGVYGEALLILSETPSDGPINLTVDAISPERLQTPPGKYSSPNTRMGIEFFPSGQIKGYWIRTTHPNETGIYQDYKWDFYPRYDAQGQVRVIHVFDRKFPEQIRGIPWLGTALGRIKDLDDWYEAELVGKQVEACFGVIIEGAEDGIAPIDVAAANTNAVVKGRQLQELEPGMIHYANNGESVKTIDPQRPGGTFAPFVEKTLRSIAATINIPYEILAKDYFRTTFSSGQLAMLDGRHGFKMRRQTMIDGALKAIWKRFVNDVVFANEANGSIDITQYVADRKPYELHVWVAPGWGFINPKDEINALDTAIKADMTNLASIYAEKGEDVEVELEKGKMVRMRQTEIDVEVRKYRMQLEEQAGLPPSEVDPTEQEDGEPSNQETEDSAVGD